MPQAVGGNSVYPTYQDVANVVRSIVNDDGPGATDTVGEGQILVDNYSISPALLHFINLSIGEVYRELRNVGDPTLIADNYIVKNLPVIHGPQGFATPSPETQVSLGYNGFFDGTTIWPNFKLPINMLVPIKLQERGTGSDLPFHEMSQAQNGLPSIVQGESFGMWEWRSDGIWLPGAVQNRDLMLRYQVKFPLAQGPNVNFATTRIMIQDCVSAVAWKTAAKYSMRLSGATPTTAACDAKAKEEMMQLQNEQIRRAQSIDYNRAAYEGNSNTCRKRV